jgi:phosphoadenosine phosphosulfate reductase
MSTTGAEVRDTASAAGLSIIDDERLVRRASAELDGACARRIVEWAVDTLGGRLRLMTALGYSGIVLMDLLRRCVPRVRAYFVDTGFHFDETLALLRRLEDEWGVEFNVLRSPLADERLNEVLGVRSWVTDPNACCMYRKVEPMLRVMNREHAWLSALRRDQSRTRSAIGAVQIDGRGFLKVHPLAGWTSQRCWSYIHEHSLPYNPLHDEGYLSIGCTHCTRPVKPGEHERSGRWSGRGKTECGIHELGSDC